MNNVDTDRDDLVGGGQGRTGSENRATGASLAVILIFAALVGLAFAAGIIK